MHSRANAVSVRGVRALFDAMARGREIARRLDTWFESRKRASEDRAALAAMSAHQLRDIGICRHDGARIVEAQWFAQFGR